MITPSPEVQGLFKGEWSRKEAFRDLQPNLSVNFVKDYAANSTKNRRAFIPRLKRGVFARQDKAVGQGHILRKGSLFKETGFFFMSLPTDGNKD